MSKPNKTDMMKLTTPEGVIYIRKDAVIAISKANIRGMNNTTVRSRVWTSGQALGFNVLEDVDTVRKALLGIKRPIP